jgi:GAF domain-containing protein
LHAADGARVGAFCIVDSKPRSLSAAQLRMLKDIARLIEEELEAARPQGRLGKACQLGRKSRFPAECCPNG